jgi:hypothetical protein
MWGVNMPITSSLIWINPIPFSKIGQAVYIVALHSTWIAQTHKSPYPIRVTSLMRSTNTNIPCQNDPNIPLTPGRSHHMDNASNTPHFQMRVQLTPTRKSHVPIKLWAPCSTMHVIIVTLSTLSLQLSTSTSTTMSGVNIRLLQHPS